ncbi:caspase family protein [Streptomyces sp. NPDC048603]|uniref:caspase family protein n=1 Tax=Streptomyces sp. NPDC048603 TaxID=3365577 RepID=UPI00371C50C7
MRRFLIAAGTRHYLEESELPQAHEDVEAVVELFTAAGYERVLAGVSLEPAAARFEEALADWCETAGLRPEDAVVLYYAGHGVRSSGGYRLACANTRHGRPGSWLSLSSLAEILAGSPVRNVLFVVDACHAAAAGQEIAGVTEAMVSLRPRGDEPGSGTWLLASARHRETSKDGAFTGRLAAAWRQGDGPSQRHLSPATLAERITRSFVADGLPQRAACSSLDQTERPPFFPNPAFDPQAEIGPDGRPAAADSDLAAHFDPRGRGVEHVHDPGSYFTGRERALAAVRAHLSGAGGRAPLVVTADPGSGKSAVLGRLVLDGHTDASVNARHQTMEALVARLAAAADARVSCPETLLAALADRTRPLRIVIDSLDEAGPGGDKAEARRIAWELLRPLGSVPCVRLVIGARREMLPHIGERVPVVDLDERAYAEDTSTAEYVAKVLADTGAPYADVPDTARRIAAEVARRADRCFLVARMTATALLRGPLVDTSAPGWAEQLPSDVGGAFEAYLRRLSRERHTATMALLTAAAFGEGNGLPRRLWLRVATELSGIPLTEADVDLLLEGDGSYLSHVTVDGTTYFRLYHQELTDHVKRRALRFRDPAEVQDCFMRILPALVPDGEWARAPAYVRSHLATHAAATGRIDDLIENAAFVLAADPVPLLAAVRHATRRPLLSMAVERAAYLFMAAGPETDRAALLAYVARRHGEYGLAVPAEELSSAVVRMSVGVRKVTPHRIVGRHAGDGYATARIDPRWTTADTVLPEGGRAVVAAPWHGDVVHVWMVDAPSQSGELPHPAPVAGFGLVGDGPAPTEVATLDTAGTLRRWDLQERSVVLTVPDTGCEVLLDTGTGRNGTPVAVCRNAERIVVFNLRTGHALFEVSAESPSPVEWANSGASACVCHDAGGNAQLLVCDRARGTLVLHPLEGPGGASTLLRGRDQPVIVGRARDSRGAMVVALRERQRLSLVDTRAGRTVEAPFASPFPYPLVKFARGPAEEPVVVVIDRERLMTMSFANRAYTPCDRQFVTLAPFFHEGRVAAAVAAFEPEFLVVDTVTGMPSGPVLQGGDGALCALHVIPARGSVKPDLLTVGNDGTARLWSWSEAKDHDGGYSTDTVRGGLADPLELIAWRGAPGIALSRSVLHLTRVDTTSLDHSFPVPAKAPHLPVGFSLYGWCEGSGGRLTLLSRDIRPLGEGDDTWGHEAVLHQVGRDGTLLESTGVIQIDHQDDGIGSDETHFSLLPPTLHRSEALVVGFDPFTGRVRLRDAAGGTGGAARIPWQIGENDLVLSTAFTSRSGTAALLTYVRPVRPGERALRRRIGPGTGPADELRAPGQVTGRLWDCATGRPVLASGITLMPDVIRLVPDHGPEGTRWVAQQGANGATSVVEPATGVEYRVIGPRAQGADLPGRILLEGDADHLRWAHLSDGTPVLLALDHRASNDRQPAPVSVWDPTSPEVTGRLPVAAYRILWTGSSPSGEPLVAVSDASGVTLCHLVTGERIWSTPVPALVTCLTVFPGSPTLDMAVGTRQGTVLVRPRLDPAWRRRLGLE